MLLVTVSSCGIPAEGCSAKVPQHILQVTSQPSGKHDPWIVPVTPRGAKYGTHGALQDFRRDWVSKRRQSTRLIPRRWAYSQQADAEARMTKYEAFDRCVRTKFSDSCTRTRAASSPDEPRCILCSSTHRKCLCLLQQSPTLNRIVLCWPAKLLGLLQHASAYQMYLSNRSTALPQSTASPTLSHVRTTPTLHFGGRP